MTNKKIKLIKGEFKKLNLPIYVDNLNETPNNVFECSHIVLKYKQVYNKLLITIIFKFNDLREFKFNLMSKGSIINNFSKLNLNNKHSYFLFFNWIMKGSHKFEIVEDDFYYLKNLRIASKVFNLRCDSEDEEKLFLEILINKYVIENKIYYLSEYEIFKNNYNVMQKRYNYHLNRMINETTVKRSIYFKLKNDRVLDDNSRNKLMEIFYRKFEGYIPNIRKFSKYIHL